VGRKKRLLRRGPHPLHFVMPPLLKERGTAKPGGEVKAAARICKNGRTGIISAKIRVYPRQKRIFFPIRRVPSGAGIPTPEGTLSQRGPFPKGKPSARLGSARVGSGQERNQHLVALLELYPMRIDKWRQVIFPKGITGSKKPPIAGRALTIPIHSPPDYVVPLSQERGGFALAKGVSGSGQR